MGRVRTVPGSRVASARSFDGGFFEVVSQRPTAGTWKRVELLCYCDGSVGLAAQESRGIENVFLDRIARRRGAAVRIEALRSRMVRIFRNRLCWSPFGVAGRRT